MRPSVLRVCASKVADGYTLPLRSRGRWHVVLTSDATQRIRGRTKRMCHLSFVLLPRKLHCVPAFQRSRGIIVKGCHLFSGTLLGSARAVPLFAPSSLNTLTRPSFPTTRYATLHSMSLLRRSTRCRSMPFVALTTHPRCRSRSLSLYSLRYAPLNTLTTFPTPRSLRSLNAVRCTHYLPSYAALRR